MSTSLQICKLRNRVNRSRQERNPDALSAEQLVDLSHKAISYRPPEFIRKLRPDQITVFLTRQIDSTMMTKITDLLLSRKMRNCLIAVLSTGLLGVNVPNLYTLIERLSQPTTRSIAPILLSTFFPHIYWTIYGICLATELLPDTLLNKLPANARLSHICNVVSHNILGYLPNSSCPLLVAAGRALHRCLLDDPDNNKPLVSYYIGEILKFTLPESLREFLLNRLSGLPDRDYTRIRGIKEIYPKTSGNRAVLEASVPRTLLTNPYAEPGSTYEHYKLDDLPNVAQLFTNLPDIVLNESKAPEHPLPQEVIRTSLTPSDKDWCKLVLTDGLRDKERREIQTKIGPTDQIQEKGDYLQCILTHRTKDEALFQATIEKRIHKSSVRRNRADLKSTKDLGRILFGNFQRAMNVPSRPVPFDPDLMEECIKEFEANKLSKSAHSLANNEARADPDRPTHKIGLFMKNQRILKIEKFKSDGKPGQTIYNMHDAVLFITGPMTRYLEKKTKETAPKNVFINTGKRPSELDEFIKRNWDFSKKSSVNDYTAYDQSQTAEFLNFEARYLRHYSIPEAIIEYYVENKVTISSFIGTHRIGRGTGEGPTFWFNSTCNIAYDHTKFDIDPSTPSCYAGDDMARNGPSIISKYWAPIEHRFSLVSKLQTEQYPGFCGWVFTPAGIHKNPAKTLVSLEVQREIGNLQNAHYSYYLDHCILYYKIEATRPYLSGLDIDCFTACTQSFLKLRHRFPSTGVPIK